MEFRALAALILRIAGLLIIVSSMTWTARTYISFFFPEPIEKIGVAVLLISSAVSLFVPILLGLCLIYLPGTVISRILKIDGLDATTASSVAPLQRISFAAIGLWLVIWALIDGIYIYSKTQLYFRIIQDMPSNWRPPAISPDDFASIISTALQFLLGIWLLFGNRAIANLVMRAKDSAAKSGVSSERDAL